MFPSAPVMPSPPRRPRRWIPWVVAGVIVLVVSVGLLVRWGFGAGGHAVDTVANPSAAASSPADDRRNGQLADQLNNSIQAMPGVVASSTRYVNDIGVSPSIRVQVTVENNGLSDGVVQGVLELVWLSDVTPLDVISIRPTVAGSSNLGQEQTWQLGLGASEDLESKFGPRPV